MIGACPAGLRNGRRDVGRMRGFTLIEVLMVVLLVGIVSGVVVLALDPKSPERDVANEMDRLVAVIGLASEEAVAENRELGLKVQDRGYGFVAFEEKTQSWQPYQADDSFKTHELPEDLKLRLLRQSQVKLPRDARVKQTSQASKLEPDVLLLSSGESTEAVLELSAPVQSSAVQRLTIDSMGGLKREIGEGGGG